VTFRYYFLYHPKVGYNFQGSFITIYIKYYDDEEEEENSEEYELS
jgi:hypothetical protein